MAVDRKLVTVFVVIVVSLTLHYGGFSVSWRPLVKRGVWHNDLSSWSLPEHVKTSGQDALHERFKRADCPRCPDEPAPILPQSGMYIPTCVFPFVWRNVTYNECIYEDNPQQAWCASMVTDDLEPIASIYCFVDPFFDVYPSKTPPRLPAGHHEPKCLFPFLHGNISYQNCTTANSPMPWCAVMLSYSHQPLISKYCMRGDERVKCVFPFVWKGVTHYNCTTEDRPNDPWCAAKVSKSDLLPLTSIYCARDQDMPHEFPLLPAPRFEGLRMEKCLFPFVYHGITYHDCTTVGTEIPWCATVRSSRLHALSRKNCESEDYVGNFSLTVKVGHARDNILEGNGRILTRLGWICRFPFVYNNVVHYKCITEGYGRPWCATVVDDKNNVAQMDFCED